MSSAVQAAAEDPRSANYRQGSGRAGKPLAEHSRSFPAGRLQQSITVLRVAAVLLDETADKKGKRGRPNKTRRSQAEKVTDAVAPYYEVQTGKAPTEHNREFTKLMNNVYKILGIKAAGHSQAAARTARINQQK